MSDLEPGLRIDDDGWQTYAGSEEYARLLEIFPVVDLDVRRFKNDPIRAVTNNFRSDLVRFFENLARFKSKKKIESELLILRKRIQLILDQIDEKNIKADYPDFRSSGRTSVKTFAELFGFVPALNDDVESFDDVVIDTAKLTNSVLYRLGLIESERVNRNSIDFKDIINKLRILFNSAEVLDDQYCRLFRLPNGRVLTVRNHNSEEFSKKFVVNDIASATLSRRKVEVRYKSDELVELLNLSSTVDDLLAELEEIKDSDLTEDLIVKLREFEEQFDNYINRFKKEVRDKLPKLGTLSDSLSRRNVNSKPLVARAIQNRLSGRIRQIRCIRPYIASDYMALEEIYRREQRIVSSLYKTMVKTQERFSLVQDKPLTGSQKKKKMLILSEWKRELMNVQFSPYLEVATLIIDRIDEILVELKEYSPSDSRKTPKQLFGTYVLDIYLLCKIDDALKYIVNCKELLVDGLTQYNARSILDMTIEMFNRMNNKSLLPGKKSSLPEVNEQMKTIWSLLRLVKSTIEEYFRECKVIKRSGGNLDQVNIEFAEKLTNIFKNIKLDVRVNGEKVSPVDPYRSMLEYVRLLSEDQNPTEVPQ